MLLKALVESYYYYQAQVKYALHDLFHMKTVQVHAI